MNKLVVVILVIVIALGLAAYSWMVLPDVVPMQFNLSGEVTRTTSKAAAIILPAIITIAGSVFYYLVQNKERRKWLGLACIGLLIPIVNIILNYLMK